MRTRPIRSIAALGATAVALTLVPASASTQTAPAAQTAPAEATTEVAAAGVRFDLPAGWTSETPSSRMRIAEASVPGPSGPARLAVFWFGEGQGGGVDANLARWASQIDSAGAEPTRDRWTAGAYAVHTLESAGTMLPSRFPGMGSSEAKPGSRLIGAVVEGPGGPWFFKLTGPDSTVAEARAGLVELLRSVRSE